MTTLTQNLLDLSDFAWQRLRDRVEGLTDAEYFWEPFDGCWSVHKADDGYAADWAWIPPAPPPFTTLAWRITHIADLLQAERTATWFGHEPVATDDEPAVPGSAEAALEALDHAYEIWRRRLAALNQEDLDRPMGEIAGPYADNDGTSFALHILDELIHHGAEVGTVRDFYRGAHAEDPFAAALAGELTPADRPALLAEAAAAQRWELIPTLADLGFSVNERTPDGATAAHLAAGTGSLDTLRFLVERGADLSLTDVQFHADVRGWAQWFKQADVADYLATVRSGPEAH
ncbi:DinB family protein [Kribbella sp. NBC_00482]|uniref:DinB family protein n=1 Tax=Kribbella sp. NBC_00482 TaxID=2975968 RepID=UPI002E19F3E9